MYIFKEENLNKTEDWTDFQSPSLKMVYPKNLTVDRVDRFQIYVLEYDIID